MANELVKMSEVLSHLGLPAGDQSQQAVLQRFIEAATPIVEYITGPINIYSYTESHPTYGLSRVMLRNVPVVAGSITSISEWVGVSQFTLTEQPPGSTHDNYGFYLQRPEAGTLIRMSAFGQEMQIGRAHV